MKKSPLLALLLAGLTFVSTVAATEIVYPRAEEMEALGQRAAHGERAAIDELESVASKLFRGLTAAQRREQKGQLDLARELLLSAFDEIGRSVTLPTEDDPAFQSLRYSLEYQQLRSVGAHGLGIAAAAGHRPSLTILLDHRKHGVVCAAAATALKESAVRGIPEAIDYLIALLDDESHRHIWHTAAHALEPVAQQGNPAAKAALEKFAKYQEERRQKLKAEAAAKAAANPSPVKGDLYIVQTGDTGARIARHVRVSLPDLILLNPGVDFSHLSVGQKIRIKAAP